jgi:hypothetical protein
MQPLRDLQSEFMDALLGGAPASAAALLAPQGGSPLERLGLYRHNVRTNFLDSLHSSFPVTWRLVGEDYFRQVALEFHASHPSRSGDLLDVGQAFPGYLATLHQREYRYLGEVARLEWLCQETLLAAERAPLDLEKLARVPPTAYDGLRFKLHPALRLYESPYPALRIWQANAASAAEPELIDLRCGADCLALMRERLELKFHRLSRGEFCFLAALRIGADFSVAIESGGACDAEFDAGAALRRFVAAEAIVDFH